MKKRILSMLLALTMVFSLVPTFSITASAEDPLLDTKTFTSGGCDITFTKNADGKTYTARVAASASDNGVMAADTTMGKQAYQAYQPVTTKLVIDDSVKQLGQGCFCRFAALKEIEWPKTLHFTAVPPQAFLNSGLETIAIPEGITSVASTAFISTTSSVSNHTLKRVELPSTITKLGIEGGVYKSFAISANASQVMLICKNEYSYNWAKENGYQAFQYPVNKIDGTNVEWSYSTYDNTLTVMGSGAIPDYSGSVDNPAPWSQYAQTATTLSINGNITGIGDYAFYNFTEVSEVSIPAVTERIGDYAFALATEDILNTFDFTLVNLKCKVSSKALFNRTKVNYSGFPLDAIQVGYCGSGSGGTYADNAQFYISADGVLVILGTGAVGDMNFDGKNAPWRENRMRITGIEVQDGITVLGMGAFAGLPNLLWENVNITTGIKTYGSNLFCYSGNSWDVVVPAHITSLNRTFVFGNGFQSGTPDIKSITFENPNTQLNTASDSQIVINGGRMDGVTIYYRNNGKDCNVKAFAEKYGCTYVDLDTATTVKTIPEANLQYETVNGNTLKLSAINNGEAISVPTSGYWLEDNEKESFTSLELADGIINIPDGAFEGYTGLKQISIPTTLKTIGSKAFAGNGASQVLSLEIPHSVTTIAADAFAGRTVTLKIPGESAVADYKADGVEVIRTFKFLLVGNSFSQDAAWGSINDYSQTWRVFDSLMDDDVELTLGLIQTGGKGLGWHATMDRKKVTEQDFRVAQYKNGVDGKWTQLPGTVLSDAFAYEEWDGISLQNNSAGVENDNDVAKDLKPVSASTRYLLDRIQKNAPYAKVYMYNVWQYTPLYDTIENVLASTNTGFENRIALSETAETYTSTDGNLGITGTVHAATAVQNARSTYLATLSHNVGLNISTDNDNVMGLQRDGVHISYSIGRYIVGLTFAKTVIPASMRKEGAVDAGPRASAVIGEMPAEYVEIARAAVDAAMTNPTTLTRLSGYTVDPAVTAQAALDGATIVVALASSDVSENAITTALNEKLASDLLRDSLNIKTLEDGLKLTVKDGTLVCDNGEYSATVTAQYGYTIKEANISGHIHTLTKTEAKAPTCAETGNSAYWTCSGCGKFFSDDAGKTEIDKNSWVIAATGNHSWGAVTYKWSEDYSQCTATLPCTVCGGYEVQETVNSTKVGATYTATFEDPQLGSTSISASTKLPSGLKLVGGTANGVNQSGTTVDGTGTNPSVVYKSVADEDVTADVKTVVETAAEAFLGVDEKVLAVVEANLYINNGGVLTRVTNAELSENIEVLVPYAQAVVGRSYILYHYNGTGFDDSIAAEGVMFGGVKYLKFQYNKFSPFVIVGGVGYNAITATTGEGYTVTYTGMGKTGEDYTFTVTVDSGYTLQSVKANGKVFGTDTGFEDNGSGSYTIKNLNDNYKIEVKVTKEAYTVTFLENGPGVFQMPAAQTVKSGDKATEPAVNPGREGYTFGGWYKEAACTDDWDFDNDTVSANTNLYAKWTKNTTHSVTYKKNADSDVVTGMPDSVTGIAAGSSYIISNAEPTRAGYTFQGWATTSAGTAAYQPGDVITSVTANVTLYAVWEQDKVTVTYPADVTGADVSKTTNTTVTENVTEGSTQTFTVTLTEGYDPATLTVTANGVALAPVLTNVATRVYTYSFVANVDTQILVSTPKLLKYTITLPTGDHFTAKFTEPSEADDKGSYTFDYGTTTAKFTVQLKDGYTGKVYIDGAAQTPEITKNGTGTYTLHATDGGIKHVCDIRVETAKVQTFTVTYTIDGQAYTTRTVDKDTLVKSLANIAVPSKEGYTFGGWYYDTGLTTALGSTANDVKVTGDMEVYGKWTPVEGHIAYDLKGGTGSGITTQTKVYGVSLQLHTDIPIRTGFTFKGWATTATGAAVYQPGDMYATEIGTNTVTLYAVWEQITFTVTLPSGTGYSISTTQSTTVNYGGSFTFTVKVDRGYASTIPTVKANTVNHTPSALTTPATDGSRSYDITIPNITADQVVSVSVTENATYTVTFYTYTNDTSALALYLTQQVEDTYKATQPAAPVMEGYTFDNWYVWTDSDSDGTIDTGELATTAYDFSIAVIKDLALVGKMTKNTYQVTWPSTNTTGWTMAITAPTLSGGAAINTSPFTVNHGDKVKFKVTVKEGYDASAMQVGVNGKLWAADSITASGSDTVYTYTIPAVTETTTITVVGVVRKTVTITYNANARDDVSDMPVQQVVKYWVSGASDNSKIINQIPVRTGYTFLGWSTNSKATAADAGYDKTTITGASGAVAKFTSDTTLYAIWKAKEVAVTLTFSDILGATGEWEKDDVLKETFNLVATFNQSVVGDVTFKKTTIGGAEVTLGTVTINGGTSVTLKDVEAGTFKNVTTPVEKYWVEFKANADEGYSNANSEKVDLRLNSRALSWSLVADGNKLVIYEGNNTTGTPVDSMTAGQTYTLVLPDVVELNAVQYAGDIVAGTQYRVKWQYRETAKSGWVTAQEDGGDTYLVTSEFSGYAFRALVEPMDAPFTKAATYKANTVNSWADLIDDKYALYLETLPTADTVRQETETALEITGADNEGGDVVINGDDTVFSGIGAHKAQFEGQTVTLTATVVEKVTSGNAPAVTTGSVEFYQNGTLIATVPVETAGANMGKASFEATMTAFTGTDATTNKDVFTAKYVKNATYDESTSTPSEVYIKSTAIQTPVIKSDLPNANGDKATTYTANLTGLLAGVKHTFTLVVGANGQDAKDVAAAANWSVVALDGRTVAAENYDIQWLVTTGSNEEQAANNETAATFVVNESKSGDKYRVKLVPTADGDMKTGATSNYVVIGTKQDVTVTVTASDEIKSTTTGNPDVYQLNPITLTATVKAAEDDATVKPSGTVEFYYSVDSGSTWTKVGETTDLVEKAGVITASITTTELPVKSGDNTKQNVKISALYSGDATFNAITDQADAKITPEIVTIYSSVVYVGTNENKATVTVTDGINISANGALKANNADVTLTLSDIYTLDHATEDHTTTPDLSKLTFGTDYTVQWWKLENANACKDPGITDSYALTSEWEKINGATNINYTIDMVPQNVAYRAEITVTGTPITKGSDTEVVQAVAGRKVYYSNVLVVGDGMLTVTTNITTSANKNFNEEGIVKGETVTIHTLVAGATGSAPVCKLEATVKSVTDPSKSFTITADGGSYTSNGYCALTWNTAAEDVTPGYYTLKVTATSNNGYESQDITRELIVRDNQYTLTVTDDSKVYNGKAQGIDWTLTGIDFEDALAQDSVVVYYYQNNKMVEPTQAGEYTYELYLPASAYWTELTHVTGIFKIEKREVSVADLVAQAKVYDGTPDVNIQEIILEDAATDQTVNKTGLPTGSTGVINGDSVYAIGTGYTDSANAGSTTLRVKDVALKGDDAANYELVGTYAGEDFVIQRSQVKGDIADATYAYGTTKVPADDIILIDQEGTKITEYEVIYYYHNGDGVKKVPAMNWKGKYTVIARPADQVNYKGGASQVVYVADAAIDAAPFAPTSTLINISNTVDLYGEVTGIDASATNGAIITKVEYAVNGTFTTVTDLSTLNVGRYLVKVTASTGDTAYGIYTIVKARPELTLTADNATYTSAPYAGAVNGTYNGSTFPTDTYFTYTGGTIQGIAYEAPIDAGNYVVTAHVPADGNYTAHEVSANFTIAKAKLTIDADELVRMQYESYPDMVATFKGLVGSTKAPDTSLRDVQIQPEFIFNEVNGGYTNAALDQVGADYPITVRNALSRNYEITYVGGSMVVNAQDANADLAIHGMIDNGSSTENVAYYGDVIQLYAYGNYGDSVEGTGKRHNPSSLIKWSVNCSDTLAEIDSQDGLLKINGVGTFTVTLTRGSGTAAISTTLTIEALKKEVKVNVPDVDKVYTASEQTYNGTVTVEGLINGDTDAATLVAGNKRTNVGSQITTYKVDTAKYVSETYGGLFTINDKEATVTPGAQTTVYGTKETYDEDLYVVTGKAGSVDPITDVKVGSMADAYNNLDVLDGYEILVAGVENINYNVKYITDQDAPDAEVTAKSLIFKTGVINSDGRTSGYMENNSLFYKDEGYSITGTTFNPAPYDRMYGEVNPVMDYLFDELIAGDSEADLKDILDWLVEYSAGANKHNISGDANVAFDKDHHLSGYRSTTCLTGKSAYIIDGILAADGVKNYTITVNANEATQNIYQRPVTLTPRVTLTAYKPSIINSDNSVNTTVLLQLLLNNLVVGEYNGKGGLATKLGHTIENLDIKIDTVSYSGDTITVTIKLGNTNYWTENVDFTVKVDPTKIWVDYGTLGKTSASVTMYMMDANGVKTGVTDVTGTVHYLIYAYDANDNGAGYSYYKNLSPVRDVEMAKRAGVTGVYDATYAALPAGRYVMFAIASNYTIIE